MPINTTASFTQLTALNLMAGYIGIPPITNLAVITSEPDFTLANNILTEATETILSQGLPCNVDYDFPLTELLNGYIRVPAGALICDVVTSGFTERDSLIYDMSEQDFTTRTDLKADITWNMAFDDLPELVKKYIATEASRSFVSRIKGDVNQAQLLVPDNQRVKQEFHRYRNNMNDISMLDHSLSYKIARSGRNQLYRRRY